MQAISSVSYWVVMLFSSCSLLIDTSKFNSSFTLRPKAGIFLASLASLSTLTITSHHHAHRSYATLIMHQSNPAARLMPAPVHYSLAHRAHGTKVTVRDLFGALPVRVKHRTISRELSSVRQKDWHSLQHAVTAILLAWNRPVSLSMRTSDSAQKIHVRSVLKLASKNVRLSLEPDTSPFDLEALRSILVQGGQCDPDSWDTWCKISARTSALTIRAIISKQPAPSKYCQFISLGSQTMENYSGVNALYDEINRIFASSSFGVDEDLRAEEGEQPGNRKKLRLENGDYTHKELKGRGKGTDKWPMFYVRIEPHQLSECSWSRSKFGSPEGGKVIQLMIEVLQSLMSRFLIENHYLVYARRSRPKEVNHQHSGPESTAKANTEDKSKEKSHARDDATSDRCESSIQEMKHRDNIASSNIGEKPLPTPQKKGDLESAIILPKPFPSRKFSIREDVGSWSRIKGARAVGLSPLSRNVTPNNTDVLMIEPGKGDSMKDADHSLEATASVDTSEANDEFDLEPASSDAGSIDLIYPPHDNTLGQNAMDSHLSRSEQVNSSFDTVPETDNSLKWTNPLTKVPVMVNRRTGLLMADPHQPAASAPNTGSPLRLTCNPSGKKCRLLRANTEPFRLPAAGTWAHELLCSWDNPVFARNESNIKQVSLSTFSEESAQILSGRHMRCTYHEIEKAFSESSAAFSAKISASDLADSVVLGQLDRKFILIKATTISPMKQGPNATRKSQMLVLVDQHAADERHGVEALLRSLCSPPNAHSCELHPVAGLKSAIDSTTLAKPINISVTVREGELFKSYAKHFADWGILFDVLSRSRRQAISPRVPMTSPGAPLTASIQVRSLPPSIAERCRSDAKYLTELLREEVWRLEEVGPQAVATPAQTDGNAEPENWIHRIRTCPPGILNMLYSRACRSAIMFNDELTLEECGVLIRRLAQCHFPFQCAHGRPTMIPLVDIGTGEDGLGEDDGIRLGRSLFASDREDSNDRFVDVWKSWRARETGMNHSVDNETK